MPPPPVTIYVTSLTSQPIVRKNIELLHRSLKGLDIPYESYDLVIDQEAKTRWQRAKPPGMVVGLPGYLVGGEWVGTMEDFEEAVETGSLPKFLKQDLDVDLFSEANKSGTIGEAELEKLMREMTEGDLDKLAEEIGVDSSKSKVGLLDPPKEVTPHPEPSALTSSSASTHTQPSVHAQAESQASPIPPTPVSATGSTGMQSSSGHSRKSSIVGGLASEKKGSRASMEEKADLAREMMTTGTIDGLLKAVEKAEGKEKLD